MINEERISVESTYDKVFLKIECSDSFEAVKLQKNIQRNQRFYERFKSILEMINDD